MRDLLFHPAVPVHDLDAAKRFSVDGLGYVLGRELAIFGERGTGKVGDPEAPSRGRSIWPSGLRLRIGSMIRGPIYPA